MWKCLLGIALICCGCAPDGAPLLDARASVGGVEIKLGYSADRKSMLVDVTNSGRNPVEIGYAPFSSGRILALDDDKPVELSEVYFVDPGPGDVPAVVAPGANARGSIVLPSLSQGRSATHWCYEGFWKFADSAEIVRVCLRVPT